MSATGTRLSLREADAIAFELLSQIVGEAHIVGSVRRRERDVGDVEIMVHRDANIKIDVAGGLWPGDYQSRKGGGRDWRFWQLRHFDRDYIVDLYRFDDLNRGSIMLIRTGPAEFSKRFVIALRGMGLKHDGGYIKEIRTDQIVNCNDEAAAFAAAGMVWVFPEARA